MATLIGKERPGDAAARERLLDAAMGPGRTAKGSERLRHGNVPAVSLSARDGDALVGTVRLWPVDVGNGSRALLLGPLAVDGAFRGGGIGAALVGSALRQAASLGWEAVVLVGDPGWYARFGFVAAPSLRVPGPPSPGRATLAAELVPGALRGAAGEVSRSGGGLATAA